MESSSRVGRISPDNDLQSTSEFNLLLRHLELNPHKKLTIMDALPVDKHTFRDEAIQSPSDIPKYIIHKLMLADYGARTFTCKKSSHKTGSCKKNIGKRYNEDDHSGDYDSDDDEEHDDATDDDGDSDEDEDNENENVPVIKAVNPMDAFLALIHCSDDFLRQDIANKLCTCQLSVPFLLPHPDRPSEEITMLLWALEGIKKTWKEANVETGSFSDRQAFVTRHPFPIVSFVRVGENEISKTRLLNEVMSDINGYHDFFFHKHCEGGGVKRKIVDGLVELCWYVPGGKEKQAFQCEVCFANLRGNAQNFQKQFTLLSRISSVILMLVPFESLDCAKKSFLRDVMDVEGKLVFIFQKKRHPDTRSFFAELSNNGKFSTIIKEMKDNDHAFFKSIRSQIQKCLKGLTISTSKIPMDVARLADGCGITVDKQKRCWKTATYSCTQVMKCFQGSPQKAKKLFKLQLHVPNVANLERETFRQTRRGNCEVQNYNNYLHELMKEERKLQELPLKEAEKTVLTCLRVYSAMSATEQNFFLTCLKHDMDNMSLQILPPLQEEYQKVCKIISENKDDKEGKAHLKQLQTAIAESSFGLEHIVREMTQIFEVTESNKNDYARIAARMLISGRPLELMDGDSLYVSLKWLKAVFDELKMCIGDANIFVISVLGIQSSGKSTMLNTMFGLQFPVSAGRCTRGAFASLIPLSDSIRRESNYEYLLIVDTEGLRGSAEKQMREHDNELATFAIGVADLTMVNIFGENHNDIQEFLQIAVHAFLKMKLVQEKRMCQIIHQNVAATNASNQLVSDRMALKNVLDEMTQLAAVEEKCESECREFNDVIVFDQNKDVSYIPSMLQGCPPMAPTSPEYGKSIQRVKEKIIAQISTPDITSVSISKFQERIKILWNAILREDFIFSFRNTKEVRAKTSLDKKFFKESVKMITSEMSVMEMEITSALKNCRPENRRELWQKKKQEVTTKAEELGARMKEEMVRFFDTNQDKAMLEQWRVNTMDKIENLKRIQAYEVENNCQTVYDHLQNRQEIDKKKLLYKKDLLDRAKKCVQSVQEGEDESVYELIFEDLWKKWIEDVPRNTVDRVNVKQVMESVLITGNEKLSKEMMERYKKNFKINEFGKHVPHIEIAMLQIPWWKTVRNQIPLTNSRQVVDDAKIIQDKAIGAAINFAKDTKVAGARCRKADLERLFHIVTKKLDEETKNKQFKFHDELTCDILLHSFGKVYPTFVEMEENYLRENDLKLYLQKTLKPDLKNYFMHQCMKIKSELSAASSFVEAMKRPVQSKINRTVGGVVATELTNISEFQSKSQLHAKALIEMAEAGHFNAYVSYLDNPVKFLKEKLQMSIQYHCISESKSIIVNLYNNEVKKIKNDAFRAIQSAGDRNAQDESSGINEWIDGFISECKMLAITKDIFDIVTIHCDLKDFEVFQEKVERMLTEYFEQIIDRGIDNSVMSAWQPHPYDVLVDTMFGCDKCCPFCRALCDQMMKDHDCDHSSKNHRPQGIASYRIVTTQKLVTSICTTNVAGDREFKNCDTRDKYHPYKKYRDFYESWSIPPDLSFEASSYWKWFMAKYSSELAEHFEAKEPEIPSSWKSITFAQAKASLQDEYHI